MKARKAVLDTIYGCQKVSAYIAPGTKQHYNLRDYIREKLELSQNTVICKYRAGPEHVRLATCICAR